MGKFLLYIAIAISIATAGIGFLNKSQLNAVSEENAKTKEALKKEQTNLAQLGIEKQKADEQLTESTTAHNKVKAELESTKAGKEAATKELAAVKDDIAKKEAEITQLKSDLDTKTQELATATAHSTTGEDPSAELKTRLAENEQLLSASQSKLSQAQSELEALRTKEEQRERRSLRDGLEGVILAVNPAYNFVVLNLGDRNGLVSNSEMLIKRGNQLLGKVRITSVEPSTSIADIVANSVPRGISIQAGDHVIYRSVDSEL